MVFFSLRQRQIYTDFIWFLISAILAMIITAFIIKDKNGKDNIPFNDFLLCLGLIEAILSSLLFLNKF